MNTFGLDIGSTSIKIAQLEKVGDKYRLVAAGIMPTPPPGIASESESDLAALSVAIKKLHQEARITTRKVVTALPEGEVYARVIELPPMSEGEVSSAIPWEAEQLVPQPLSEVTLDWQILAKGQAGQAPEQTKVFLVAAPKVLIQKYLRVLNMAGLEVAAIETELISATRALLNGASPTAMVVDFGAKTTDLAIVKGGQVIFTRSLPTAGEAFTRAISTGLSLEEPQAEEYKRAYGLEEKQLEGKIKKALDPVFQIVTSEIKKALASWKEKEKEPVTQIILTGGSANLPQVSSAMTNLLGLEVQVADPLARLSANEKILSALKGNSCLFAVAVGLAAKEV